jgi:MFS family permease
MLSLSWRLALLYLHVAWLVLTPLLSVLSSSVAETFTVDLALESYGLGKFQYKLFFKAGPIWIADAMEIMLLGFLYEILDDVWDLTSTERGLIGATVFGGMFFGAFSWGIFSDRYGRRKGFALAALTSGTFGLLSAFTEDVPSFLLMRFGVGIGVSGGHCGYNILAEYLPPTYRARGLLLAQLWFSFGALVEVLLAWMVLPTLGWRWLLVVTALPCFATSLIYFILPETPHFYQVAGMKDKALMMLVEVAAENEEIVMEGDLEYVPSKRGDIASLFSYKYWRTTLPMVIIWMCGCFTYYGIAIVTPILFGLSESGYRDIFLTTLGEIPGMLIPILIVDIVGRIKTMRALIVVAITSLFAASALGAGTWLQVVMVFVARMATVGAYGVVWLYTSEVYPTVVRGVAMGTCSSMARVAGIAVSFAAISVDPAWVLIIMGCVMVTMLIFTMLLTVETAFRKLQSFELDDGLIGNEVELGRNNSDKALN